MSRIASIILAWAVVIGAQQYDKYIWETHRAVEITGADNQILVLRSEVDKILSAGHLRPLRAYHTDLKGCGYFVYSEPGRIITTLGLAYPYLTEAQKTQAQTYVRAECGDAAYAPWSSSASLPIDRGAFRNYADMIELRNWSFFWGMDGQKRPRLHTLYGLWAYAYNSGDTSVVRDHWTTVKSFYASHTAEGNTYGEYCGHLAMARLSHMMADNATMNTAVTSARNAFTAGQTFSAVTAAADADFDLPGYDYGGGSGRNSIHDAFYLLNVTCETGRYLSETGVKQNAIDKNAEAETRWPMWWLYKAPYFTVWGTEEGVGMVPELIGMVFPVERWVAGASNDVLKSYRMHRAMYGIGDCYVLEAIVNTINALGTQSWVDVRTTGPTQNPITATSGDRQAKERFAVSSLRWSIGSGRLDGTFRVSHASSARVDLFALNGKRVSGLEMRAAQPGVNRFVLGGPLPAGSYVMQLRAQPRGRSGTVTAACRLTLP